MAKLPTNKKQRYGLVAFIVVFAVAGVALLLATRAASPVVSFEPEKGSITAPAVACTDSGASSGGCLKFLPASAPPPTSACTRTISTGTSITSTINTMSTGQTLCLNSGNYGESVTLGRSITLQNAPGATPTITKLTVSAGSSAVIGLEITGGSDPLLRVNNGISNVLIKRNKIHDGSGNGVRTWANNVTFESNEFYSFANEDAIRLWGDGLIFRNNYIHDVQNSGHNDPFQTWLLAGNEPGPAVTNLIMEDNIVRNFPGGHGHCFMAESTTTRLANWTIVRNRFENIGSHCFILGGGEPGDRGVANVDFFYNKFMNIGGASITCSFESYGRLYGNTFVNANSNIPSRCAPMSSAPAGVSPNRPNYDVTWPI